MNDIEDASVQSNPIDSSRIRDRGILSVSLRSRVREPIWLVKPLEGQRQLLTSSADNRYIYRREAAHGCTISRIKAWDWITVTR